ncbi:MAG: sensor histidine kinase [Spirochaetales bacterium]
MKARPLFSRLFGWFLLLLVLVVLVVAASLAVGVRSSFGRWETRLSSRIELRVAEELESLVARRTDPTGLEVERALRGVLAPGVAIRVHDARGDLLFAFHRGQRVAPPPATQRGPAERRRPDMRMQMDRPRGGAENLPTRLSPAVLERFRPVAAPGSRVLLYFRAASEGFLTDEPNRILFSSIVRALIIGLFAAVVLASVGAWLLGRNLARSTRRIAEALADIADGARTRVIEQGRVAELNQIACTAERLQNDLSDQERIRAQWAQDVAHDLRTPIAAVMAQLEAVRDGVLPATTERYEMMLTQVGRVGRLVEQLNLLTRLESPEHSIDCDPVTARDAVKAVVAAVSSQLPDGEEHSVTADEIGPTSVILPINLDLVLRAVANIVDNALRYRVSGTPVTARVQVVGNGIGSELRIVVRNRGTLPERSKRLFDRLTRGESERSSEGLGLGLSIARAVALRHEGRIELYQRPEGLVETVLSVSRCGSSTPS